MGFLSKLQPFINKRETSDIQSVDEAVTTANDEESSSGLGSKGEEIQEQTQIDNVVDPNAQHGVKDMEAITIAWSKKSLFFLFFMMWNVYLLNAFQSSTAGSLVAYVTSDWGDHSLLTVIDVVASSMTAAVFIPLAKFLDVWGRAEGFLMMSLFSELGLILMATSHNLATYCAANVFYSIGFTGIIYTIDVMTADTTQLKNRGFAYAFTSSPYMISAFAGSYAADKMLVTIGWGWGFACFAFILPVICLPLYLLLKINLRKAEKEGVVVHQHHGRTLFQSFKKHFVEFDVIGMFLFAAGLVIFLLPFNIAYSAPNGWATGYIIAMIVVGFVLLVFFVLYEVFIASDPFMTGGFLADRTLIGACLLDFTYQVAYYCWDSYFTSFLQVVNYCTVAQAGYINNTFSIVSGFLLFGVGWAMRKTGKFKWLLWMGLPIYILAQGLMIYFRHPTGYIGYIVMTQIFIAVGGSVFIICMQVAVLASVDHQHVAAALAILNVTGTVGDAVGGAISGAIWTNTFEKALYRYLPESALDNIDDIFGDIDTQLSYARGTAERLGIQQAYAYAQTRMLAVGTGIMGLGFVWVWMMRDLKLSEMKQTRGNTF